MPSSYPSRDLTDQYISLSYQDVVQKYSPDAGDPNEYFLDGLGNVIVAIPSSSIGNVLITSDVTSSMVVSSSLYTDYANYANYANVAGHSITSDNSTTSDASDTAVYANTAGNSVYSTTASYAFTSSYELEYEVSTSWASSSISSSFANRAISASWAPMPTISNSSSWASASISSSYSVSSSNAIYSDGAGVAVSSIYSDSASVAIGSTYSDTASYLAPGATLYLSQSYIIANTNSVSPPWTEGMLFWDQSNHTYAIYNDQSQTTLQIGQENWVRVIAGENLGDSMPVYVSSSIDPYPVVAKAEADAMGLKSGVVGLTTETISSGSQGWITTQGRINGVNTLAFVNGGPIWLSATVPGGLQPFPPGEPYARVLCGYCIHRDLSDGKILVAVVGLPKQPNAYAGITSTVLIDNNNDGTITVSTGSVNLFDDQTGIGTPSGYSLQSKNFNLITGSTNYVIAERSASLASYGIVTDPSYANGINIVRVATLDINYKGPGNWDVHEFDVGIVGLALANKINNKDIELYGFQRQDGLTLFITGSSGSFGITEGTVWYGPNDHTIPTFDTTLTDHYSYVFSTTSSNGTSSWNQISQSTFVSSYYNSGSTGLTPCAPNSWSVNYVYRLIGTSDEAAIVMSSEQFATALEASNNATTPPNLPSTVRDIGLLVGRFVVQSGSFSPTIESAFSNIFVPAVVTDHESLLGLQGGIGGEHKHLTAVEYLGTGTGVFLRSSKPVFAGATPNHIPYWKSDQTLTLTGSIQVYDDQYVLINSGSPNPTYPEALLVFQKNSSSVNCVGAYGEVNNFFQVYNQNFSSGSLASSDICATADIGNQNANFIDMGVGSSNYANPVWPWVKPLDGYIQVDGGDFWLATTTDGKLIRFLISNSVEIGHIDAGGFTLLSGKFNGTASISINSINSISASFSYTSSYIFGSDVHGQVSSSKTAETASYIYTIIYSLSNYDITGSITYVGEISTTTTDWRISKMNTTLFTSSIASGTSNYATNWTNRYSLIYV